MMTMMMHLSKCVPLMMMSETLSVNCSVTRRCFGGNPKLDISGVFPPIPTPFKPKDGSIHYDALISNLNTWNKIPFAGYVIMGSNGEAVSLSHDEKLKLLQTVRSAANKSSKIIAGLGLNTAYQTVELINAVAKEGTADAALIVTPYFYKGQMSNLALRKYFEQVATDSHLPIILYSVPGNTALDLQPPVPLALSRHPNCIGLKDSGGDITKIAQIVHETKDVGFQVLAGSAGFFLPSLLMGCVGGICALANVLGPELCQLYTLATDKRMGMEEAVALQRKLISPNNAVTKMFGVSGLKGVMDVCAGLYGGPCRSPLMPLEPQQLQLLKDIFKDNQFIL